MSATVKFLTGAAGLVALVGLAAPAAAQGYPYGYGGYNQGYGNNGGVVGAIVNSVLGYGRYPYGNYGYGQNSYGYQGQSTAVSQCARAAEARLGGGYGGYGGYGGGYGNNGYNNGYGGGGARVVGISRVDRKSYGYRVYGVATDQYGNNYRGGYGQPTVRFDCKVEYNGRVRDVNVNRNMANYRYGYGW